MSDLGMTPEQMIDWYNFRGEIIKELVETNGVLREENERLKAALEDVLSDIAKSEHVNNLYPSPGKSRFWKSVVNAEKLLK